MLPLCLKEMDACQYFTCWIGEQMGCYPQDYEDVAGGGGAVAGGEGDAGKGKGMGVARVCHERGCTELEARYTGERDTHRETETVKETETETERKRQRDRD